jgi:hypothetical protein
MHVETSFARNLGGLIRVRQGMPDRLMKAKGRTMSMYADEESDEGVVPMKRSNNEGVSSAETVEGRTSPKGNGGQTAAARTLRRDTASNGLAAVRQAARQSKTVRFTALLHHITTDLLKRSYLALARDAAPGTDGVTWQAYGESLEEKLKDLHDRVHRGSYRARPARRTYIPKADGSKRPLSILMRPSYCTLFNSGWNGDTGRVGNPLPQSVICRVGDRDDVWQAKLPLLCCYEAPVDPVINHPHTDAVSFANLFDVECIGGKRRAGNVMLVADPTDHGDREASAS